MRIVAAIAFGFVLLFPLAPAWADFEAARAAYARGDFAAAFDQWGVLSRAGDPAAQYQLGQLYAEGLGTARDEAEALRWIRRAAERDYPLAQYVLGVAYEEGQGVPQDFVQAQFWFNLATDKLDAEGYEGELAEDAMMRRDGVSGQLNAEQMAEARRLTREWRPTK